MGKKKIAKKFAAVKRIISSQDDRMYTFYLIGSENKIKKNSRSRIVNVASFYKNKPPTIYKSNKCTSDFYSFSPK